MYYTSTRNNAIQVTAAQAIAGGISPEGGLYVPSEFPALTAADIEALLPLSYKERATKILSRYLNDFTGDEVEACCVAAYGERFDTPAVAPLHDLGDGRYVQELWHGPTCAFKDMALQILPHLMRVSVGKTNPDEQIVILVATSGDTGKAALEGFKDAPNTRILVFYPVDGVSEMQRFQMVTQEGDNVGVCAIRGNFDDAQTGVKAIFTDDEVKAKLAENGMRFSSANSINWGRLVPQIVYYISAYCDLVKQGKIANGDPINVVVPTGNFGNILACYYAKRMGLPVNKLICASNRNRVLTDFFETGVYDCNRPFYTTTSPSMDILVSSNLERLLYHLSGNNSAEIADLMAALKTEKKYAVSDAVRAAVQEQFVGGCADDDQVAHTIKTLFDRCGYLCDTHTAVAVTVYDEYRAKTGDETPTVIASTASPYKFAPAILEALGGAESEKPYEQLAELNAKTGLEIPQPLGSLRDKAVRFTGVCDNDKASMQATVYGMLNLD
ncbi:MAG: threonine synthase [Ruminococcaceae bacterium]|nr:threonine synthase [Oscillospiraceae bacterium]